MLLWPAPYQCAGVSVHSCTATLSLCVSLACGRTVGADNIIDQTRCRYVLKCLSSFETNLPGKKKKSVFCSEVQRTRLHSRILTNLFYDGLEQSSFVTLQLNPIEDVVASRLEDSKGYLHLLLCPKLKASSSLCKVRETEPACPERILGPQVPQHFSSLTSTLHPAWRRESQGSFLISSLDSSSSPNQLLKQQTSCVGTS